MLGRQLDRSRRLAVVVARHLLVLAVAALVLVGCGDGGRGGEELSEQPSDSDPPNVEFEQESETDDSPNYDEMSDAELAREVGVWRHAFEKMSQMTDRLREQHFQAPDAKVSPVSGMYGQSLASEIGMSRAFFETRMGQFAPENFILESFYSTSKFTIRIDRLLDERGDSIETVRYDTDSTNVHWDLPESLLAATGRAATSNDPGFNWIKAHVGRDLLQLNRFAIQGYLSHAVENEREIRIDGTQSMIQIWQITGTRHLARSPYFDPDQFFMTRFDPATFGFRLELRTDGRLKNPSQTMVLETVARAGWWHGEIPPVVGGGNEDSNGGGGTETNRDPRPQPGPGPGTDDGNGGGGESSEPSFDPSTLPRPTVWIEVSGSLTESEHWPEDYDFHGKPIADAIADMLRERGYGIARNERDANAIIRASVTLVLPREPHRYLGSVTRIPVVPTVEFEYEDKRRTHDRLASGDLGGSVSATAWERLFAEVGRSIAERNARFILERIPHPEH